MGGFEYRIFFPIGAGASASSGSSSTGGNAPDIFDSSTFEKFHPGKSPPKRPGQAEERTDVYILDQAWPKMGNYGLKLRGASGTFDPTSSVASSYTLELKVRRSHHTASSSSSHEAKQSDGDEIMQDADGATADASDAAHGAGISSPEDWKKVVSTSMSCSPSTLVRSVLQVLEGQLRATDKSKAQYGLLAELVQLFQQKRDAELARQQAGASASVTSATSPAESGLTFVEVRKRRIRIPNMDGEQTDVDVRVLRGSASSSSNAAAPSSANAAAAASSSSSPTYHFRSICFEGSESDLKSANIKALFTHILSAPSSSTHAAATSASHSHSPTPSAVVAGYPEFLLRLLAPPTSHAKDSTTAAAPGSFAKRVELKKWNAVSLWSWDIEVDNCAICRNLIMELCIECQANRGGTQGSSGHNDDCTVAWGVCNHAFHFHCITRWLRTRPSCPLDNEDWEFAVRSQ